MGAGDGHMDFVVLMEMDIGPNFGLQEPEADLRTTVDDRGGI